MRRPAARIPRWESTYAAYRAEQCIGFLAVHGLLSDGEKAKAYGRLRKSVDAWNAKEAAREPAKEGT